MSVLISYAHEPLNPARAEKVRLLAERLRSYDVDVLTDLDDPAPGAGWLNWMSSKIEAAGHVLMVCSETYRKRYDETDDSPSYGAGYEGRIIRIRYNILKEPRSKYVPILFEGDKPANIPLEMLDHDRYELHTFGADNKRFAGLVKLLTGRAIDPSADAARPRLLEFQVEKAGDGGGYVVRLDCEGLGKAESKFDWEAVRGKATTDALGVIASGQDEKENLRFIGILLWRGLISDEVGEVGKLYLRAWRKGLADGRLFHLRLALPHDLEDLPWEALYSEHDNSFLATREQFCLIRTGGGRFEPARPRPADRGRPSFLIVAPETPGLELAREVRSILDQVAATGDLAEARAIEGRVTVGSLSRAIQEQPWDVVHFAGHGRLNGRGEAELRLNDEAGDEHWVVADQFATLFNHAGTRLIVLNCCRAAAAGGGRTVAGLGPILIGRQVAAVVAMQYEIADHVALRFAEEFYRVLLTGRRPGRVDVAIEATRVALFQSASRDNQRGFVTPSLFLAPGGEQLFTLPDVPPPPPPPGVPVPPGPARAVALPSELIRSIREGRCIPVLGPGMIAAAAFRDAAPPLLRDLARDAAKEAGYGEDSDFDLLGRAGDWLERSIFHRVCQHPRTERGRTNRLRRLLEDAYRPCKPSPSLVALARWDVPGYICLSFDGLLERALKEMGKSFVALGLDDPSPTELGLTRLVSLCGVWGGRANRAPALTERDFDRLLDKLGKPPDWLTTLITDQGSRSLLFLGAHPRDPLARRLASGFDDSGVAQDAGPIYFASLDHRPADDAYWKDLAVEWLDVTPSALIEQVDAALAAGREAER